MNEPMTEAGRALLDDYPARYGGALYTDPVSRELTIAAILEIEVEAARTASERADRLAGAAANALDWFVDGKNPCQWCGVYEEDAEGHEPWCGVPALRAALRDTASTTTPAPYDHCPFCGTPGRIVGSDEGTQYFEATPAPQADGLDVERLARAMHAKGAMCYEPRAFCKEDWIADPRHDVHMAWAAAIARAYADAGTDPA